MKILDACCGSKMFWFDREHKETVYMDNRMENTTLCDGRKLIVKPDIVADFRKMPFENETFLTPKECWRLQGFSDEQYEKAATVNSNSQLYKQAGNAVTVNVVEEIGRHIMKIINE